jgi:HPt (histidine-containing phosphotransfer) domain-containing protein
MRPPRGQVRLDDLLGVCRSGDQINYGLLKEMLLLFIEENRRRVDAMLDAAAEGNDAGLRGAAHALKGSAALVGADRLRDLAGDLELGVLSGTSRDPKAAAERLRDEYTAVVATLRTLYPDLVAAS